MQIPPRALHALIDLKRELLSREAPLDAVAPPAEQGKGKVSLKTSEPRTRHTRRPGAFQRMCQRRQFRF
jgi:hypothetical protein